MAAATAGWLVAGRVGRPHGLDGSFIVVTPDVRLLASGAELTLDGEARRVERRAGTDARPILRLDGCTTREDAEALRGRELLAPREAAPPLEAHEYWAEDLAGCEVVDGERHVGRVRRMVALPSCEMLEVERDGGGELLVPLVRDAIRNVDIAAKRIDVALDFVEGR